MKLISLLLNGIEICLEAKNICEKPVASSGRFFNSCETEKLLRKIIRWKK